MGIVGATLVAIALVGTPAADARLPVEVSVEAQAARLVALAVDPDPVATAELHARVRAGAAPGALMAMLDALRERPRADLGALVQTLAGYRRVDVRGRALAAWAALGERAADLAIAAAVEDTDLRIRRLAVALAERYPSAAAQMRIAALLAADPELAAELAAAAQLVPVEPS